MWFKRESAWWRVENNLKHIIYIKNILLPREEWKFSLCANGLLIIVSTELVMKGRKLTFISLSLHFRVIFRIFCNLYNLVHMRSMWLNVELISFHTLQHLERWMNFWDAENFFSTQIRLYFGIDNSIINIWAHISCWRKIWIRRVWEMRKITLRFSLIDFLLWTKIDF